MTFITIATSITAAAAVVAAAELLRRLLKQNTQLRASALEKEALREEYNAEWERLNAALADAKHLLEEAEAAIARERALAEESADALAAAKGEIEALTARAEAAEEALRAAEASPVPAAADDDATMRMIAKEMALRRSITEAIELLLNASASPSADLLREEVRICISSLNDALTKK